MFKDLAKLGILLGTALLCTTVPRTVSASEAAKMRRQWRIEFPGEKPEAYAITEFNSGSKIGYALSQTAKGKLVKSALLSREQASTLIKAYTQNMSIRAPAQNCPHGVRLRTIAGKKSASHRVCGTNEEQNAEFQKLIKKITERLNFEG